MTNLQLDGAQTVDPAEYDTTGKYYHLAILYAETLPILVTCAHEVM